MDEQAAVLARSFTDGVDAELNSAVAILDALAQTRSLRSGQFADFQSIAEPVARHNGAAITVRQPGGQHLMNTLIPYGSGPLPKTSDPVLIAADRRALSKHQPVISDFYIGATSHSPYVAVIYPVTDGGHVTYLLTMAFSSERVQSKLQLGSLAKAGWSATIVGSDGVVLARTRQPETYIGRSASIGMKRAIEHASNGTLLSRTLDGIEVFSTFRRTAFGWTTIVSAPVAVVYAPARRVAILAGAATICTIGVTLLAAWLYGRRLGAELDALGANAAAIGQDSPLIGYTQHISEAAEAQKALFTAKDKIDDLLRELNHRVRNTLTIIKVIASRSLPDEHAKTTISGRVGALARAHELLSNSHWRGADLCELIQATGKSADLMIECIGPEISLTPKATVALAQVFQELLSNAREHGSLSCRAGLVDVSWQLSSGNLIMIWKETRLAPDEEKSAFVPAFGMQIIDLCIRRQLNGSYETEPKAEGWVITLFVPLASELGEAAFLRATSSQ